MNLNVVALLATGFGLFVFGGHDVLATGLTIAGAMGVYLANG